MGLLRFLLAACVIRGHSSGLGLPMLDAGLAVKTFFMISGFYMTLILHSKYRPETGGYWLFISNRILRIYPAYLVMLGVSGLFYAAASVRLHAPADRLQYWVEAWHGHRLGALGLVTLSQFTIIGLDVTPMLDFTAARGFAWVGTLGEGAIRAWRFNFLPHAWSISVELVFYAFAPFICRATRRVQVSLLLCGLGLYVAGSKLLPPALADAARYHFFPFQVTFLLLGVLSYHLLHPLFERGRIHKAWTYAVLPPFFGVVLAGDGLPPWLAQCGCVGLGFFAIPLLFNVSRRARLDRFVGDLSYPMYLSHITCKWVLLATMGVTKKDTAVVPGWELLLLTVATSIGIVWLIDYPVDRWRQNRVAARAGVHPHHAAPPATSATP